MSKELLISQEDHTKKMRPKWFDRMESNKNLDMSALTNSEKGNSPLRSFEPIRESQTELNKRESKAELMKTRN